VASYRAWETKTEEREVKKPPKRSHRMIGACFCAGLQKACLKSLAGFTRAATELGTILPCESALKQYYPPDTSATAKMARSVVRPLQCARRYRAMHAACRFLERAPRCRPADDTGRPHSTVTSCALQRASTTLRAISQSEGRWVILIQQQDRTEDFTEFRRCTGEAGQRFSGRLFETAAEARANHGRLALLRRLFDSRFPLSLFPCP